MKAEFKGHNLTLALKNFSVSYDDMGTGEIPIIFLHGYPFDRTMWRHQMDFFADSNRVIAIDIRGFGNSKDETSSLSIDLFGDDLIKFMDKLKIDKAVICGLSMGGYVALNVMKRFPERFEALILCDTQCLADTNEVKKKRYKSIDEIKSEGVTNFNEKFIKSVFHVDSIANKKELVAQLRTVVFSNSDHIISEGLLALAGRSESFTALSEIIIPTLIICGREDAVTPLAQSEYINKITKRSILRVIEHAGHVSNLEQPLEFNKHLDDFLIELSGSSL